jgi:hypothetical protein
MQCLTPDKLTSFFGNVVGVCESIFVVGLKNKIVFGKCVWELVGVVLAALISYAVFNT